MSNKNQKRSGNKTIFDRMFIFPAIILSVYVVLFLIYPDKTTAAAITSGNALLGMLVPLILIFLLMLLINMFLNPARIAKFLGKGSGIKGIVLSAGAGIISTGPIYAWYPLLRDLREKGAGDFSIAIFLYNRAVKPFLLPIMIAYLGWIYVITLTVLTILASVIVGYSIDILSYTKRKSPCQSQ